jgi:MFS family permease
MYNAPLFAASLMSARPLPKASPPPTDRLRTAQFTRVTVANFCFFMTFASFFLLPLHVRALGGSERVIGFAMGMTGLSGLLSVFVIGTLLDRFGRRIFLLGGIGSMAVASASFLFVDRIGPALFVLRGIQGLAFAAGFNAASTLAVEFAPAERRAAALGLFGVSTLATHALAPSLGELIVHRAGFPALFVVAASFSLAGLAVAWPLQVHGRHVGGVHVRLHPTRRLSSAVATVACCGVAFGTVLTYVPTFVQDTGLGPVSVFFLTYTGAAVLTRVTVGGLGDAFGRRTVIVPALGLLVASIVALAAVRSVAALAGAALLFGTAQGIVYPTLNAFTIDQAEESQFGRAQTLYNGAFNLGVTSGSILLGPVVEAFGYRATFLCGAGLAAAALVIFAAGTARTSTGGTARR